MVYLTSPPFVIDRRPRVPAQAVHLCGPLWQHSRISFFRQADILSIKFPNVMFTNNQFEPVRALVGLCTSPFSPLRWASVTGGSMPGTYEPVRLYCRERPVLPSRRVRSPPATYQTDRPALQTPIWNRKDKRRRLCNYSPAMQHGPEIPPRNTMVASDPLIRSPQLTYLRFQCAALQWEHTE